MNLVVSCFKVLIFSGVGFKVWRFRVSVLRLQGFWNLGCRV